MGTACFTMKVVAALVTLALHQATADWSGSGEFSCYGHVSTDVSSPEGGDHLGEGTLRCNIIEWGGGPLGPEAMFFKPNGGAEFEIWAWTTMIGIANIGQCLTPHARDRSGTRRTTWVQDTAHPTRASPVVDMATVWETLSVSAADNSLPEISLSQNSLFENYFSENSPSFQINYLFPYFR